MSFWDRLLGREDTPHIESAQPRVSEDQRAIERYRYLLRTAPPETIEQVHEEAFARLTPDQRAMVYRELSANAAPGDQPVNDNPAALARSATRSELRSPGTMERAFGDRGASGAPGATGSSSSANGPSFGAMVGSSLLGTVAGYVIGSALVGAFFPPLGADVAGAEQAGGEDQAGQDYSDGDGGSAADGGEYSGGFGGDFGGGDFGGGDFGGDFGF